MAIITRKRLERILEKTRHITDERLRERLHAQLVTRIILRRLEVPKERRKIIEGLVAHISDTSYYVYSLAKKEANAMTAKALLEQHIAAITPAVSHFEPQEAAKVRQYLKALQDSLQTIGLGGYSQTDNPLHAVFQLRFPHTLREYAERAIDFVLPADKHDAFEAEQESLAKFYSEFARGVPRN